MILRQRLIAVPQDPVFLPDGTSFRASLDPSNTATPAECQKVLEAVRLWPLVQEQADGLDVPLTAGKLSAKQRQLFSLGRAVLRAVIGQRSAPTLNAYSPGESQGGILILDEVSSSVDRETERIMQEIIREEFAQYTVIAVSHRLEMIMDFNRVVVMDRGIAVEVGNPVALREVKGSWFGELVAAAGA
ncbi:P-loop containing nucleoside triphosphate hydrolase protein [Aspergillus venezuelensis]